MDEEEIQSPLSAYSVNSRRVDETRTSGLKTSPRVDGPLKEERTTRGSRPAKAKRAAVRAKNRALPGSDGHRGTDA